MSIFVSTTFAPTGSRVTDIVPLMLDHGITRIELGSTHVHEDHLVQALQRWRATYVVHNYFPPPADDFVVNLASLDGELRQRSIDHACRCINFAGEIGARLYTCHPGFLGDPRPPDGLNGYDFQFSASTPAADIYERAFDRLLQALGVLVSCARAAGVQLAIESEGSFSRPDRLLLQRPDEFDRLLSFATDPTLGISVNLGHLNLAAHAFGFDPLAFVDRIAERVAAFEISHNEGRHDEHRPPVAGAWYWPLIRDRRFRARPMVLECRDCSIATIAVAAGQLELAHEDAAQTDIQT